MRGTIDIANTKHGRYSARLDDGSYIAFSLEDSVELYAGDEIKGTLDGHGGQDFILCRDGEQFSVSVEMIGASRITAGTWAAA